MNGIIQPYGSFLDIDADGFIVNPCHLAAVQPSYRPVLEAVKAALESTFADQLHSVYIRGSVAKGQAIEGVSDLDGVIIWQHSTPDDSALALDQLGATIQKQFPFLTKIEWINASASKELSDTLRFVLRTQTLLLTGSDIRPSLPRYKPGASAKVHSNTLLDNIEDVRSELLITTDPAVIQEICTWIMKRIVRTSFELVMERDRSFTRDLYPCYTAFVRYYPDQQLLMYDVLYYAVFPTDVSATILQTIDKILPFLKRVLGA